MLKDHKQNLNSAALVKLKEAAVLNEKMVYAMLETSEEGLSDNTVKDRVKFMVKRNCNAEGSFMVKAVCTFIFQSIQLYTGLYCYYFVIH